MRRRGLGVALAAMVLAVGAMAVFACGNGANDPAGCRELENARCSRALECGIDLMFPLHAGDTESDAVQACQDYYNVACDHGFVTTITITPQDIAGCRSAILQDSCNVVINPQLAPLAACAWLVPPDAGVDAPVDVVVSDVTVIVTTTSTSTTTGDAGESEDAAFHDCVNACDQMCASDPDCMTNCESDCANGS